MPTNQIWNTSDIWGFMLGPQNAHGSWEWNGDNSTIDRYDVYERKRELCRRPCSCLSQEMYIQTCGVDARCKGYSGNATTNITPPRYQDQKILWSTAGIWFMLGPKNAHRRWEWNGDNSTTESWHEFHSNCSSGYSWSESGELWHLFPETARPITAAILETCHSPVACSAPHLPFPVKKLLWSQQPYNIMRCSWLPAVDLWKMRELRSAVDLWKMQNFCKDTELVWCWCRGRASSPHLKLTRKS